MMELLEYGFHAPLVPSLAHTSAMDAELERFPPVLLVAGWYDFFMPEQLRDFAALRRLSPQSRLVVGPWTHWHVLAMAPRMHQNLLAFFDAHLKGNPAARPLPVASGWQGKTRRCPPTRSARSRHV